MKTYWTRYLLLIPSLPNVLFGYLLLLFFTMVRMSNIQGFHEGCLQGVWTDWTGSWWRYSNAFGRALVMHPRLSDRRYGQTLEHEMVHIRQGEDYGLLATLLALGVVWVSWETALVLWCSQPLWPLVGFATAFVRYGPEHTYRGSEPELSAYAQTKEGCGHGQ